MALSRISKVIQTEATTPSKGDFLLTHLPFENLFLEDNKSISENDLLKNILLKDHSEHKLIMIQGSNGSGKSHLIRWLKEKYQNNVDSSEAVLFISRAHNTLQDALTQLLESDIFPDKIRENELKHIKNSKSNITGKELNKTINFNFTLEIDADEDNQNSSLDVRTKKWLSTYLKDNFIQSEFLLSPTGPIERIRAKIEITNEDTVISGDDPAFVADDFNITISQIKQKLNIADGRAADFTIRLAEKFADTRSGAGLRQKVADYLNTKVSNVVQRSMKLQTADFKKLFVSLRKSLKLQGVNLTLFVEDINSFTGIDEALMEVLLTDHTAEGNDKYCRLISVVGSTNAFYRDKLNASIKERIKTNIFIREHSVIGTKEQLCKFAAKYINAINISDDEVTNWEKNGANDDEIPQYKCSLEWANIDFDGITLSIFPFNDNALLKLYNSISAEKRTPRIFLKSVISHVLKLWHTDTENFLSDDNNFSNTDILIPYWDSPLYNQTNLSIDENSATERGILLRLWGDGTAKSEPGRLGGLTDDIFKAFNVYSGISGEPQPVSDKTSDKTSEKTSEKINEKTNAKKEEVNAKTPLLQQPQQLQLQQLQQQVKQEVKNPKLVDIEKDLLNWFNQKDPSKCNLANHVELRELVSNFIVYGIDWEVEGIPNILVKAYINTRGRVHIEGQPQAISDGLLLKKNEETFYLLTALVNFKFAGANTWYFDGGEDYLVAATAWLDKHKQEIIETVVAPKNQYNTWDLPLWNIAAIYCIRTLFEGLDISKSSEDIAIDLLGKKMDFTIESTHSTAWKKLQENILKNDKFKSTIFKETFAYFSKSVGNAEAGATTYVFVDALELINQINKLKTLDWELSGLCPTDVENYNSTWYYSANFINIFIKNIERILNDENIKADEYLSFFDELLSGDFSEQSISESLQAIKDFLKFLTDRLNSNYVEEDYKIVKQPNASEKLLSAISGIKELKEQQKPSEILMKISENPFEDISEFYSSFVSFKNMLDNKEKLFNNRDNSASDQAQVIEKHRNKIIKDIDFMLQTMEMMALNLNN